MAAKAGSACLTCPASCLPFCEVPTPGRVPVEGVPMAHMRAPHGDLLAEVGSLCILNTPPPHAVRRLAGKCAGLLEAL